MVLGCGDARHAEEAAGADGVDGAAGAANAVAAEDAGAAHASDEEDGTPVPGEYPWETPAYREQLDQEMLLPISQNFMVASIDVDEALLYFNVGRLYATSKTDPTTPTQIAPAEYWAHSVFVDDTHLYTSLQDTLYRQQKDDGSMTEQSVVDPPPLVMSLAGGSSALYLTTPARILASVPGQLPNGASGPRLSLVWICCSSSAAS